MEIGLNYKKVLRKVFFFAVIFEIQRGCISNPFH